MVVWRWKCCLWRLYWLGLLWLWWWLRWWCAGDGGGGDSLLKNCGCNICSSTLMKNVGVVVVVVAKLWWRWWLQLM